MPYLVFKVECISTTLLNSAYINVRVRICFHYLFVIFELRVSSEWCLFLESVLILVMLSMSCTFLVFVWIWSLV